MSLKRGLCYFSGIKSVCKVMQSEIKHFSGNIVFFFASKSILENR